MEELLKKRALTISEAATYACVSRATLLGWITSGILPFEDLPGRGNGSYRFRLVRKSDLDEFLNRYYSFAGSSRSQTYCDDRASGNAILLPKET